MQLTAKYKSLEIPLIIITIFVLFFTSSVYSQKKLLSTGWNAYNQLGDGTFVDQNSINQIGVATNWNSVACSDRTTLAIKSDGTLWAWGYNTDGQVGDATNTQRSSPVQVGVATNWQTVITNSSGGHSLALKSDGTLWAWGLNSRGQLGIGNLINKNVPTKVNTDTDWQVVSAGDAFTVSIKSDGSMYSWGYNNVGELGIGSFVDQLTPVRIGALFTWSKLACGNHHSLAIKTDGTLWAWGDNTYGQIGDNTTTTRNSPKQIGTDTDWSEVYAGYYFSIAKKVDGTLWAWGQNSNGELGDGTNTDRHSPVLFNSDANWSIISCGDNHTLGIKSNGTLWAWGNNFTGQLGIGNNISKNVPFQVGVLSNWLSVDAGAGFSIFLQTPATAPTLTTTAISSLTGISSSSGGNVSSDGGSAVTARGVVWSTSTNPTTALATKTSDGTGTGSFTSSITGLSLNTTYYVRAYATNSIGTSYGNEISFTTLNIATLTTTAISLITGHTASSGGNISSNGGSAITAYGIVWGTASNPTIALATKTNDGSGTASFTSSITGLSFTTTYYVRSYATNSVGTSYGNEISFTSNASAIVTIYEVSSFDSTKAIYNAEVLSDGGSPVTERGIVLSSEPNPTISSNFRIIDTGSGLGTYSATFTGLKNGKKYFARSYAINVDGISYSADQNVYTHDEDGISYDVEKEAPNHQDGNGDGIPDYAQNNVVSLPSIKKDYITISTGDETKDLIDVKNEYSNDKSNDYIYPFGINSFKINASSATVTSYFHGTKNLNHYLYRKQTASGRWIVYDKATFSTENIGGQQVAKVTLVLYDGDPASDADGRLNGVIDDPGGPALFVGDASNIPVWDMKYLLLLLVLFPLAYYYKF
ncbi:MAG: hypothetical protein NTW25_13320 [Candidatus Kapabacteria bacterium]|nr:hypothetical protein [Candidatus Kapabacteria bacterium]